MNNLNQADVSILSKKEKNRKRFLIFVSVLLTIFGGLIGLFVSNWGQITSSHSNNVAIDLSQTELVRWEKQGDVLISEDDPWIIIDDVNTYVNAVSVPGKFSEPLGTVQIFYTTGDEDFSEAQSIISTINKEQSSLMLPVGKYVTKLRIDLTNIPGVSWRDASSIILNPPYIHVQIQVLAFFMLIGFVCSLFFRYRPKDYSKVKDYLTNAKRYEYLLRNLVSRDIITKYRRSVLGILWSVLNPLLMMLVITMVFQHIFRSNIDNFPIYYLTGSLIFNFVVEATNGSMMSILGSAPLIKKVYIPKYIFPLEKCLFALVNMLFSLIAVIIIMLQQQFMPHWTIILFPIPILYTLIFCIGLGLILASLNVFFRDTSHLWGVFLTAWMYLTPIIYPMDILPLSVQTIVKFNPLYYYVDYFRQVVMYGTIPNITTNLVCIVLSVSFLILGVFIFKKTQDKFILYI